MADGIIIESKKILEELNSIDDKIEDLVRHTDDAAKDMQKSLNGIDLSVLRSKLDDIKSVMDGMSKGDGGVFKNVSESVKDASKNVSDLARIMDQISLSKGSGNVFSKDDLNEYKKGIKEIKSDINTLRLDKKITLSDALGMDESSISALTDKIRGLKRAQADVKIDFADENSIRTNQGLLLYIDELSRKLKSLKTLNVSFDDAISFSNNATSINQRIDAIKRLKIARDNLSSGEIDYKSKLDKLNDAIRKNTRLNEEAVAGAKSLKQQHAGLINTSDQLIRKFALVFSLSQGTGYIKQLAKVRGEFELQNKALAAILQNKDKADILFNQITDLAVRSPFQLKELVSYTKQLAAYRVESEKLFDTTKMLADVSAGLGVDMERLILAYGQVKAANYLRGTELRQFSEAGINILGELSDYFTEIEGRAVSVGDVFERVSKRMVSFADVEVVFKRLTESGGIFYNMQEIQAETLQGQISNLRDSIDIMLNEIGKGNEGVLKAAIGLVRSLVENYQVLETVLNGVGVYMVLYAANTIRASVATGTFNALTATSIANLSGLEKVVARLVLGMNSLGNTLKAHPIILIASVAVAAASAFYKMNQRVNENREAYDVLSNSVNSSIQKLKGYSDQIDKQNKSIKEANSDLSKYSKGTDDYSKAQEKANTASKEQQVLIAKLKKDYPELYQGIVKQKDGTIELNNELRKQVKILEDVATLNALARSREGLFEDSIIKDAKDLYLAQKDYSDALRETEPAFNSIMVRVRDLKNTTSLMSDEMYDAFLKIADGNGTAVEKFKEFHKLISTASGQLRVRLFDIKDSFDSPFSDFFKNSAKYQSQVEEFGSEVNLIVKDALSQYGFYSLDAFKKADDETKKAIGKTITDVMKSIPSLSEEAMQSLAKKMLETRLEIPISFSVVPPQLDEWQKKLKKELEDRNINIGVAVDASLTRGEAVKQLQQSYKAVVDDLSKAKAGGSLIPKEEIDRLSSLKKGLVEVLSIYNIEYKTKKEISKEDSAAVKLLKDQIDLIKKLGKEYEDRRKNFDQSEAIDKTKESYKDLIKTLKLDGKLDLSNLSAEGITKMLTSLAPMAKKAGHDAVVALEKSIAESRNEIEVNVRVKNIDQLGKDIDSIFSKYDLSLELDKLGLDKSIVKDLFDIDATTLDDVKKKLAELKPQFVGTDAEKEYEKYLNKVSDMENKAAEDRLKKYSEYLKKSVSQRLQIEIDAQKKIDEATSLKRKDGTQVFDPQAIQQITERINKERQDALNKLNMEEFQGTDWYVQMFSDLETTSTKALEVMKQKLDELKSSMGELSPEILKTLTDQYNKLSDELVERNPFKALSEARKEVEKLGVSKDTLELQLAAYTQEDALIKERVANLEKELYLKQQLLQYDNQGNIISNEKNAKTLEEVSVIEQKLEAEKEAQKTNSKNLDNTNKGLGVYKKQSAALKGTLNTWQKIGSEMGETYGAVKNALGAMGVETDSVGMQIADTIVSLAQLVIQALLFGAAMDVAMGPIGWIALAIQGIAMVLGGIFGASDKGKEKRIQREKDKVDDLKRSYEKLEKAIDNAYSIDTVSASEDLARKNIDDQIASYQKMIKLEEDKKKTDQSKIKEYRNAIEDLIDKKAELEESILKGLGGIGSGVKDAAQEFVDAWANAFQETGDGLSGLQDKWDEYINNVIKKQLILRATSSYLEPLFKQLDEMLKSPQSVDKKVEDIDKRLEDINKEWETVYYVEERDALLEEISRLEEERAKLLKEQSSYKNVTKEELDKFKESINTSLPAFNDVLESLIEGLGGFSSTGAASNLDSLQKGIEGITESTAGIIEGYMNSIRFEMFNQSTYLMDIRNALIGDVNITTPILNELRAQTYILSETKKVLDSVVMAGHRNGGYGIKVYMD